MRSKPALLLLVAILALTTMGVSTGPVLADGDDNPLYPLDTFPPTAADNAVLQWNEELLECFRTTKPGPTVVARALFVVSAAGYDAWSAYDAKAVPTIRTGFTRRPSSQRTLANRTAAVSYASHRALAYLTQNNPFQPCRADLDERLTALGLSVAEATSASPVTTPGTLVDPWRWQPVRVLLDDPNGTPQTPLTPHWGKVRSFDPKLLEQAIQAPDPFKLSAQERSAMIDELVRLSAELTDRTKVVWIPYQPVTFPTPPFPAYTSGHSTFSGAAAAYMKDFAAVMGRDGDVFGATITWNIDDTPAPDVGKKCGEAVFSVAKKLWEGG